MHKVMFVDDEALLALSAEGSLRDAGYEVAIAFDGQEALQKAETFAPDIVVTDYMMPRLDGVGLARAMAERGLHTPVVLLTAVPQRNLPPGVDALFASYLAKPVQDDALLSCVAGLLRLEASK